MKFPCPAFFAHAPFIQVHQFPKFPKIRNKALSKHHGNSNNSNPSDRFRSSNNHEISISKESSNAKTFNSTLIPKNLKSTAIPITIRISTSTKVSRIPEVARIQQFQCFQQLQRDTRCCALTHRTENSQNFRTNCATAQFHAKHTQNV